MAGIAVTFIFNWRIGLTVAVVAAIIDTIQRSQTTAAMPPARRGAVQRKTERKLEKTRRRRFLTLNERAIPGSEAIIDHLVVGPTGVYAIDSERWDKRLPVRVLGGKQQCSTARSAGRSGWRKPAGRRRRRRSLSAALSASEVDVRPAIAIYGPKIPWT